MRVLLTRAAILRRVLAQVLGVLVSWAPSAALGQESADVPSFRAGPAPNDDATEASPPAESDTVGPRSAETQTDRSLIAPQWLQPGAAPWPPDAPPEGKVEVVLLVEVDRAGVVLATKTLSPPREPFTSAALRFAERQKFVPAMLEGSPRASRVKLVVAFEPPPPPGEAAPAPDPHQDKHVAAKPSEVRSGEASFGALARVPAKGGQKRPVAASDQAIEVGALAEVPRGNAMQLATLAPGIVLTNHAGEGHAQAAYLRGFDAGEGQDLELRVQNITINEPSNAHGHGYADTNFVVPELVSTVHVRQGAFDARQGDFSAAGTIAFRLRAPSPGIRLQTAYGSFERRRVLLAWSPKEGSRETFAAFDAQDGAGFGPNRAYSNLRAMGQFHIEHRGVEVRVFMASHGLRFDSAGVVREDAVRDGEVRCAGRRVDTSFCVLDPNQGGNAARHLASVDLATRQRNARWTGRLTVMKRDSRFRENFTGALLDARGDALDEQTRMLVLQLNTTYRLRRKIGGRSQVLELGLDGRHDSGHSRMWRVRRDGQIPYASVFDNELALTRVSGYATGELNFAAFLSAQLGVRVDGFGYSVVERDRPVQDLEGERLDRQATNAFGTNVQPRATLSLGPFAGASWVSSFGIGSRSSDAAALSEGENAPFSRIWAAESGLTYRGDPGPLSLRARSALFFAHVDRDLLFDETRGRNVPIGATNRYGAFVYLRAQLGRQLDVASSFTWAEAHTPDDEKSPGLASGPRLPFVPRFVLRGDAAYVRAIPTRDLPVTLSAGIGLGYVGRRPLPLNTLSPPVFSLDASARARYRFVELSVSGTNLTGNRNRSAYFFYPSDFGTGGTTRRRTRHFSADAPRQWMATLALLLDYEPAREEDS